MLNQDRLKEIESKELFGGSGNDIDHACVMQMVSYVANEPWSDHPSCACPILTNVAIRLNDLFTHEHRQLLKPLIPALVGTVANDNVRIARKRLLMWRYVTVTYPLILESIKMPKLAVKLRAFPNTTQGMQAAAKLLEARKDKIERFRKNATADAYADAYATADAYAYADAYATATATATADAYATATADAYADATATADAYAYADANAYATADAYAYADANAYAYRKERLNAIAKVAIESLRLAIAIVN